MLPVTPIKLKKATHINVDRLEELGEYFDRIRMAIVHAGSDPYIIRDSVERQLSEMEEIFKKIKGDSTTL